MQLDRVAELWMDYNWMKQL